METDTLKHYDSKVLHKVRENMIGILKRNKLKIGRQYNLFSMSELPIFEINLINMGKNIEGTTISFIKKALEAQLGEKIKTSLVKGNENKQLRVRAYDSYINDFYTKEEVPSNNGTVDEESLSKTDNDEENCLMNEEEEIKPDSVDIEENEENSTPPEEKIIFGEEELSLLIYQKTGIEKIRTEQKEPNIIIIFCGDYHNYQKIYKVLMSNDYCSKNIEKKYPPELYVKVTHFNKIIINPILAQEEKIKEEGFEIKSEVETKLDISPSKKKVFCGVSPLLLNEINNKVIQKGKESIIVQQEEKEVKPINNENMEVKSEKKRTYTRKNSKNAKSKVVDPYKDNRQRIINYLIEKGFSEQKGRRHLVPGNFYVNESKFIKKTNILIVKILNKNQNTTKEIFDAVTNYYFLEKKNHLVKIKQKEFQVEVKFQNGYFEEKLTRLKKSSDYAVLPSVEVLPTKENDLPVVNLLNKAVDEFILLNEGIKNSQEKIIENEKEFLQACSEHFVEAMLKVFKEKKINFFITNSDGPGLQLSEIPIFQVKEFVSSEILKYL